MSILALALIAVQLLTVGAGAAHLFRVHRRRPERLPRSVHLIAAAFLATSVLPLVALLTYDASVALWGLWAIGYNAAALVWAGADTARDIPAGQTTSPAES
ncbi:hypothetical protein [Streptomyces sp. SAI-090]|uniref:hypothetical protein n=1 Tax=Streptomyces sp. SAI-090 TaxID=2940545 RepID=UPI00247676A0|nr:hypothetical protein [Streptomyces sp. SAI-090]MDH6522273.1 amino acid transporter [Streptomyces sp. SAI-090]